MTHRAALTTQVTKLKAAASDIFPRWDDPFGDKATAATDLHRRTAPRLRKLFDDVDLALRIAQVAALEANTDADATDEVYVPGVGFMTPSRQDRLGGANAKIVKGREQLETARTMLNQGLDEMSEDFKRTAVPQRPQPADAAQEAALGNLRLDLRMILDAVTDRAELVDKVATVYANAVAENDLLRAWFLAGTSWPSEYLETRGVVAGDRRLAEALAKVDNPINAGERSQALRGYRFVENGRDALRRVPEWLAHVGHAELTDIH